MTQYVNYYTFDPITRAFERVRVIPVTEPMPSNSVIDAPPANTPEWSRINNEWVPTPPAQPDPEPVQGSLF